MKSKRLSWQKQRFLTQRDMSECKHQSDVQNSRVNRGEIEDGAIQTITPCGCGAVGCFIHTRRNYHGC